jgi:cation:H+ antiporter
MFAEKLFGEVPNWALFLELFICGVIVTGVGARLTYLADAIGDRFNIGKAWIGLILLASITSLPEVVTGITAVSIGEPDLAFGNIFGSCMFNVAIIVVLNGFMPGGSILKNAKLTHSLSSSLGIVLMTFALLGCTVVYGIAQEPNGTYLARWIEGAVCLAIFFSYFACIRLNSRLERRLISGVDDSAEEQAPGSGVNPSIAAFVMFAVVLIGATFCLTKTADILDERPLAILGGRPLGATFVGAFFLSVCTSLPEIATSVAAVRMGHLDLALGNIFGSNMFNVFVIPLLKITSLARGDALLMSGPNFSLSAHTLTGFSAILITSIAVASLVYRTQRRVFRFGFDSALIGVTYIISMSLLLRS